MVTITAGAGEINFTNEIDLLKCLERLNRTGAVPVKKTETQTHIYYTWYGVTFKFNK